MKQANHQPLNYSSQEMATIPAQFADFSLDDEAEALRNIPKWLSGMARKRLVQ